MRLARLKYIVKDCRIDRFRQKLDLSPIVVTIADILVKTVPNRYFKGTDWSRQKKVRPSGFEDYGRNQIGERKSVSLLRKRLSLKTKVDCENIVNTTS